METLTTELERLRDMLQQEADGIKQYLEKYEPNCNLKYKTADVETSLRNHVIHIDNLLKHYKGGDEET